jgi:hypothetical protein
MNMAALPIWAVCAIAALFQLSLFFVRGALYASTRETQELIDAREHHLREIEAHAKARKNAKRREKYAANVVSING